MSPLPCDGSSTSVQGPTQISSFTAADCCMGMEEDLDFTQGNAPCKQWGRGAAPVVQQPGTHTAQLFGKSQLCGNWHGKGMAVPGCKGVRYWGTC